MTKPVYWLSMRRWMALTLDEHRRLEDYVREMGLQLGVDLIGDRCGEKQQDDFQRDDDEFVDDMGLGGKRYRMKR
jgi:hypothetical protein